MAKKSFEPKQSAIKKSPKYQVDVRNSDGLSDTCILETNDFNEAYKCYSDAKTKLSEQLSICSYDMVVWYVGNDTGLQSEYVPVVMCMVETAIKEW